MGELWLEGYSGQTTDELIGLADRYRTDSIVLAFEQAIWAKVDRFDDWQPSWPERVVLAVEVLERGVNSDGYLSLFATQAEYIPDLVPALTAIGATAAADVTRSALDALGIDEPATPAAIREAAATDDRERDAAINSFDHAYYQVAGDLAPALLEFIRANRDQIVLA